MCTGGRSMDIFGSDSLGVSVFNVYDGHTAGIEGWADGESCWSRRAVAVRLWYSKGVSVLYGKAVRDEMGRTNNFLCNSQSHLPPEA